MRIKDIAQATGVEVDTIRYYEKQGLLAQPARSGNGYRAYAPEHVQQLAFIRHCRALDMPLADIRHLQLALASPGQAHEKVDALIDEQIKRVQARLDSMRALKKQLVLLRSRCGAGVQETAPCGILNELVAAAQGEACVCHQ